MPFRLTPPPGLMPFTVLRLLSHPLKYTRLVLRLLTDSRVPLHLKAILIGAVAYVLSPIDLIPEIFLPLLGEADDAVILLLAVHTLLTRAPRQVVEEHALAIAGVRDQGSGKNQSVKPDP